MISCSRVFVNVYGPEKYSFYYDAEEFFFSYSEMCFLLKRFLRMLSFVDISIILFIMFVLVSTYDPRYLHFLHDSLFLFFTLMLFFSVLILFIFSCFFQHKKYKLFYSMYFCSVWSDRTNIIGIFRIHACLWKYLLTTQLKTEQRIRSLSSCSSVWSGSYLMVFVR